MYGCSLSSVEWFSSYLSNRSQRTNFKGELSNSLPVSLGVPQGSILGPLFFLLFINDLPLYISPVANLTMFADDTSVLVSGPSVSDLNDLLNSISTEVYSWATFNRMALNTKKTKSLMITSHQKFSHLPDPNLKILINGTLIDQVSHAKLLGITVDSFLTWEQHIDNMCSQISSRLCLLRRIQPFLTDECILLFYNSCIHSTLLYCSSVWGNCSLSLLLRLLRLQKRAARLILGADFTHTSVNLFTKLKWLPISLLINLRKLVFLFNIVNKANSPLCLKSNFNFLSSLRSSGVSTRASITDLHVIKPRTNFGKRTFTFSAAYLYNCLDSNLKHLLCHPDPSSSFTSNLSSFKSKILQLFLQFSSSVSHLEELFCLQCRYKLRCHCIT